MYLVFNENDINLNLQKFNRWNYAGSFILQNINLFTEEFLLYWQAHFSGYGFAHYEQWVWDGEKIICQPLVVVNPNQKTFRWDEPTPHPTEPWIAFLLPPEWGAVPAHLKAEALSVLGTGEVVSQLNW